MKVSLRRTGRYTEKSSSEVPYPGIGPWRCAVSLFSAAAKNLGPPSLAGRIGYARNSHSGIAASKNVLAVRFARHPGANNFLGIGEDACNVLSKTCAWNLVKCGFVKKTIVGEFLNICHHDAVGYRGKVEVLVIHECRFAFSSALCIHQRKRKRAFFRIRALGITLRKLWLLWRWKFFPRSRGRRRGGRALFKVWVFDYDNSQNAPLRVFFA